MIFQNSLNFRVRKFNKHNQLNILDFHYQYFDKNKKVVQDC